MKKTKLSDRLKSRKYVLIASFLLLGFVSAFLILRSQASGVDIISIAGRGNTCENGGNSLVKESRNSNKSDLVVCELNTGGRYWPSNYELVSGTYDKQFSKDVATYVMVVRKYVEVETCFFMKAIDSEAFVDFRLFGSTNNGRRENVRISQGNYKPYCYVNNLAYFDTNQNASLHNVLSGKVRVSSVTLNGIKQQSDETVDVISYASNGDNCVSGNGVVQVESSDNSKKGLEVCRMKTSSSYWPSNYNLASEGNLELRYNKEKVGQLFTNRGYNQVETCFVMKSVSGVAKVDFRTFGDKGSNFSKNNVSIEPGEYRSYCYQNNFTQSQDIGNAFVSNVNSGEIMLSSIILNGSISEDTPVGPVEADYFVDVNSSSASDNNNGKSESTPFKTIKKAVSVANAGEVVYVKQGTYREGNIDITKSGTSSSPIVISAFPGHERKAVLDGGHFVTKGVSFVEIRNFKIQNSNHGFKIEGPANNTAPPSRGVVVDGNWTYRTVSSGIAVWGVNGGLEPGDYDNIRDIKIINNRVEDCVTTGFNECITVANGVRNIEVAYNEVTNPNSTAETGGEGIDFKEGVIGGKIHHNTLFNMVKNAIYMDGGGFWTRRSGLSRPKVENIDIYSNTVYNIRGAGITIVNEGPADVNNINIYNNIVYNTTRHGISVYNHPGGSGVSSINRVNIINNTSTRNGTEGSWGGIAIDHNFATNIVIRNNIAWGNTAFDMRSNNSSYTQDNNLCRESFCEKRSDPLFIGNTNFVLRDGSPAINSGSAQQAPTFDFAGTSRPQSSAYDMGAFER